MDIQLSSSRSYSLDSVLLLLVTLLDILVASSTSRILSMPLPLWLSEPACLVPVYVSFSMKLMWRPFNLSVFTSKLMRVSIGKVINIDLCFQTEFTIKIDSC